MVVREEKVREEKESEKNLGAGERDEGVMKLLHCPED